MVGLGENIPRELFWLQKALSCGWDARVGVYSARRGCQSLVASPSDGRSCLLPILTVEGWDLTDLKTVPKSCCYDQIISKHLLSSELFTPPSGPPLCTYKFRSSHVPLCAARCKMGPRKYALAITTCNRAKCLWGKFHKTPSKSPLSLLAS